MAERLPNNGETGWGDILGAGDGSGGFLRVAHNDDGTLKVAPLTPAGVWDNGTDYVVGNVVTDSGSSYVALADNTGDEPPSASWQLLAAAAQLPSWLQSGSGSPIGAVVPVQVGALYQDTTNGALYEAVGATNADWVCVGGQNPAGGLGVNLNLVSGSLVVQHPDGYVALSAGDVGTGETVEVDAGATPGQLDIITTQGFVLNCGNSVLIATDASGGLAFYDGTTPIAQATLTGALSAVADPAVAALFASLIAALGEATGVGLFIDGTT